MESITKNRQQPQTLRAMIELAYGPDQVPLGRGDWLTEEGHGWFNVVYRIRLRDGRSVALKIAPPPGIEVLTYEHGAMRTELTALRLIHEHTKVPVPNIDYADLSHELITADYFFMPYVEADNLGIVGDQLTAKERDSYNAALGAINCELNTIRGESFGPLTGPGNASWRSAFTVMFTDVLRDGQRRSVDIGLDYDDVQNLFDKYADCLDEVTEPRFVEWDLWDSNVMIHGGKIVSIIDHERAFFGDPLIEAGFTGLQVPEFGDSTAFMRGYGRGPLSQTERVRRHLYTLYLVLIMTIETVYRGHTDTQQYDWARARVAQVVTALEHLP